MNFLRRLNPWRRIRNLVALCHTLNKDVQELADKCAALKAENNRLKIDYHNLVGSASLDAAVIPFYERRIEERDAELEKLKLDYRKLVARPSLDVTVIPFYENRIDQLKGALKMALTEIVTKVNPLDTDTKWYRESMSLLYPDGTKKD